VLAEMAFLGLEAIELGPPGFLPADPEATARTLRAYDLRLAAGFVPAVLHRPAERPPALAAMRTVATALSAAGADVLVLAAELGNGGYERSAELSEGEWGALVEGLEEARALADQHGLRAAFHPHFGTAVERAHQIERLVASSDIPLCLDTGHLLVGGVDPLALARSAAGRIAHVHLKDADTALAARVRAGTLGYHDAVRRGMYRPLGEGDLDVAGILARLSATGYDGWYVLEQDIVLEREPPPGAGPLTDAARSVDFIRRIMHP
jgi:inosose dehydratase